MSSFHTPSTERLFQALTLLHTAEEFSDLFEDLCTIKEIQDMAQRLETVIQLDRGLSYQDIAKQVGTSTATTSRVSRALNYGTGGYRMILDRMKEQNPTEN